MVVEKVERQTAEDETAGATGEIETGTHTEMMEAVSVDSRVEDETGTDTEMMEAVSADSRVEDESVKQL
ncbi:LOW QUALITY PROTEIN: hypothetical protein PoB_005182000 [Plakobranchus ocellatus]|uniref:Uncharacterized protein n=1 Tax=Plakobranchus ocellatus TaxID=259542 RepID=A0AAV4BY31_9GAST|nr:LOW QUALITY PROTEIN: hypothetical protein PoB_005182000 [Plakobranchus ocellatus]